jgi:pyridoxamine 5'-phosphate oxidase
MDICEQALKKLHELRAEVRALGLVDPDAATLSTVDTYGRPSSRTILVKQVDARGFVFFTNFNSRKGRQLLANPNASICMFWQQLRQQVLIDGEAQPIDDDAADQYWRTRTRDSQLAAWASHQSEPLSDRALLTERMAAAKEKFRDLHEVPRPLHWSGFLLVPRRIEFWRVGWSRLHERVCYEHSDTGWERHLLYP